MPLSSPSVLFILLSHAARDIPTILLTQTILHKLAFNNYLYFYHSIHLNISQNFKISDMINFHFTTIPPLNKMRAIFSYKLRSCLEKIDTTFVIGRPSGERSRCHSCGVRGHFPQEGRFHLRCP